MTTRRTFLKTVGATSALMVAGAPMVKAAGTKRVVVVGGGFGGSVAARYVKAWDPSAEVTLIDANKMFSTCVFSNLVLADIRTMDSITFDLTKQADKGIKFVNDMVTGIDADKKTVALKSGGSVPYDKLILSPGIAFKPLAGYDEAAMELVPHAWKAGPQTVLLKKQLEAMEDGGVVVITAPPDPFRCPPGPYERASMIAAYLKAKKPKSKVVILDSKDKFSKQGLFQEGWEKFYPGMIDWVSAAKDGKVTAIDAATRTAKTEFESHKAAVLNVIPAQTAGKLCIDAGLTNEGGWCPVDFQTFESKKAKDVYVIGDASVAAKMPKSGNAANTQAKVAALAVVNALNGKTSGIPTASNTCYSLITNEWAFSVTAIYKATPEGFAEVEGSGGLSPTLAKGGTPELRKQEREYGDGWYNNIVKDTWT